MPSIRKTKKYLKRVLREEMETLSSIEQIDKEHLTLSDCLRYDASRNFVNILNEDLDKLKSLGHRK